MVKALFQKLFPRNNSGRKQVLGSKQKSDRPIPASIEQAANEVQSVMGNSADLMVHRFQAFAGKSECAVVYLKSFTDIEELNKSVLAPLQRFTSLPKDMESLGKILPQAGTRVIASIQALSKAIAWGDTVLLVSGFKSGLEIPLKKYQQRPVEEPDNEKIVRGPRDGFVESIWSNAGLLRQRIKNPDFRLEVLTLGTRTSVEVGIVYVEGIANRQIVSEVRQRLERIEVDRLLSSGYVGEFTTDSPWSPFPTSQFTERPDHVTAALLDGRIGILIDGTPIVTIVPVVFWDFLKSPDDYIESPYFATLVRLIRLLAHLVTLLLPGAYVAVTTFHLEMLPQTLAMIIAGARTRTPFPVAIEMLTMELTVEILREAGLRMPGSFGQTMSIVGALVIGEASVTAGLIEPIIVVIVAFTTLASFIVPGYNAAIAIRLLRFPLVLLSAAMGIFGLALGAMFYLYHLVSLRSFGVPYFAPVAPLFLKDMGDTFIRLPWYLQSRRPTYYRAEDEIREGRDNRPGPEKES